MTNKSDASATLALTEETVTVSKVKATTGRVRVRTVSEERDEAVSAVLESETFDVVRVPIDREVDVAPTIRTEGDLTIIPVMEEILVVEKRLLLKEEIHLRRRKSIDPVESVVTLRRQRAEIERLDETNSNRRSKRKHP